MWFPTLLQSPRRSADRSQGVGLRQQAYRSRAKQGHPFALKHSLASLAALFMMLCLACGAHAQQALTPAYHDGSIVFYKDLSAFAQVGMPGKEQLYSFGFPVRPQLDVLAKMPGQAGYNPLWEVIAVIVLDGRDVGTNPYTSEADILAAAAASPPKVALIDTNFSFLCPVVISK